MKLIELVRRKEGLLFIYSTKLGLRDYIKKAINLDFSFKNHMYINNTWYLDKDEDDALLEILKSLFSKDLNFLKKLLERGEGLLSELISFSENVKDLNLSEKDIDQLKKYYLDFFERYNMVIGATLHVPIIAWNILIAKLEKELERKIDPSKDYEKFKKYIFILTATDKESAIVKEHKALIKICMDIKDPENLPLDKIKDHAKKYGWMNVYTFRGRPYDVDHYISRIKELLQKDLKKELQKIEIKIKKIKDERKKILKEINPSEEFLELLKLMQEYVYFRNYRRYAYSIAETNIRPLFEEIAKRLNLNYDNIVSLTDYELVDYIKTKNKKYLNLLNERKKEFAIVGENIDIYSGKELEKVKKKYSFLWKEKIGELNEFKGDMACSGKVKGVVKVIFDPEQELNKVKKGDILVTNMTTPDFVPAMEKASAIVTDRGGILCHAAIISREMNKPCIIGTKIATKVLKDGDLVEVDADKGVVRKIK